MLGEVNGDLVVGVSNLATSVGGLLRPILKPIPTTQAPPLFRNVSTDFASGYRDASNVALGVEAIGSTINIYDTLDRVR